MFGLHNMMHQRIIKLLVDRISNNQIFQSIEQVIPSFSATATDHFLLIQVTDNLMEQSFLLFIYISIYDATLVKLSEVKGVTDYKVNQI